MPLVLRPRTIAPSSSDISGITPDRLSACSAAEVAARVIVADGRPAVLGDCFTLSGSPADDLVVCEGDFSGVDGVGAGMTRGRMEVRGDVGRHAGAAMAGGTLVVAGDAAAWLAVGMQGGTIHVRGNAGDDAAAAAPGAAMGVTGGLVIVAGDAGRRAGARMRRGILAIGGDCGDAAGLELRAGTIIVGGRLGADAGVGMRRGSIIHHGGIDSGRAPDPGPWFVPGAVWEPPFFRLLDRRLREAGFRPGAGAEGGGWLAGRWRQWHGDMLAGGRGEFFGRVGP